VVTQVSFPLPLPFIFTASGNVLTTPSLPVEDFTVVLRPRVTTLRVTGDRTQILKRELRTDSVQGNRRLQVRRESRLTTA
jgi:hypothetical protein